MAARIVHHRTCSIEGCSNPHNARGLCCTHYHHWQKYGDPLSGPFERKTCEVEGCDGKHHGRGYCARHYHRWKKHGDPLGGRAPKGSLIKWLKAHVDYDGESCLIWPFGKFQDGYGQIGYKGKHYRAHRLMCMLAHGDPEDEGMVAAHSCGEGHNGCVNPNHVYWATYKENVQDSISHGTWVHGSQVNTSKLTEDDVREIRSLFGEMSYAALADKFGVTKQAIYYIRKGKNWSWLE